MDEFPQDEELEQGEPDLGALIDEQEETEEVAEDTNEPVPLSSLSKDDLGDDADEEDLVEDEDEEDDMELLGSEDWEE